MSWLHVLIPEIILAIQIAYIHDRKQTEKKYLNIGILVEKTNKSLHKMKQEINTAK